MLQHAASGTHLALFTDDACTYATKKHKHCVLCTLQHCLAAMKSWCECWNIIINEKKTVTVTENCILVTVLRHMVDCFAKYSAELRIRLHYKYSNVHTHMKAYILNCQSILHM
jgi:hypothetical protein